MSDIPKAPKHRWGKLKVKYNFEDRKNNRIEIDGHDLTDIACNVKFNLGHVDEQGFHLPYISMTFRITECEIDVNGAIVINGMHTSPGVASSLRRILDKHFNGDERFYDYDESIESSD